jgi:phage terminase large subunit
MQKIPIHRYTPDGFKIWGQMWRLWSSHASVKIAGGTYDAGKTYSLCAYIDWLARKYRGARMTFVHRSLNRVYRNILPTYYKYLGYTPTSRDASKPTYVTRFGGEKPEFFEYPDGTRIYVNGLDKPQNLLSDFFDAAFVNQCELLPFEAWDELTARVSERAGVMPIAMLMGDCNPNAPHHWIRQQTKDGKLDYFRMSFLDNPEIIEQGSERLEQFKIDFGNNPDPKLLNQVMDLFSESGLRRVEKLKNLDGLRFKRGFLGLWASGEGLVFEDFEPETHVVDTTIMPNWRRYLSVDWGYRNPASVIWWALSPDDRLYAYKEIYKTKLTKPDLIALIKKNCDPHEDKIHYAAVDSEDQDGVEQLRRAKFRVIEPKKDRVAQIDAVKERLKKDQTGQPSIFFLRDRLVHPPDEDLKDDYRPVEVTDEFLSLSYAEKLKGTRRDDEDVVGDNHGVDGASYLIQSLGKQRGIGSGRVIHGSVKMR